MLKNECPENVFLEPFLIAAAKEQLALFPLRKLL